MKIEEQIRYYRKQIGFSQEMMAEKKASQGKLLQSGKTEQELPTSQI